MKRPARFVFAGLAGLAALVAVATLFTVPPPAPAAVAADFRLMWPVARGAYHVHSSRSDGTGTIDEIAQAAAQAGLQFVILTDHGNGTRVPDPPRYRSGVLCIDGVEISTDDGHYVALGLPTAPYPLAGEGRAVVEDVRRLGGFGFAAHPGSEKEALRWTDWEAPIDGLEWLNADSEWRDESWGSLARVLPIHAWRPVETLAGILDRPREVLKQWDQLARTRRVAAIAGHDAHARLGFGQASDPYQDRAWLRVPAYDVSFRAFVNHVILDGPLTGDADTDARLILGGMREGRMFTSIDGFAGLGGFEAKAVSGRALARPGEYLDTRDPVSIEARIAAPDGTRLSVVRNGETLYEVTGQALRLDIGSEPGAYRVEAHLPESLRPSSVPWVLSNPIYVGLAAEHERALASAAPPRPVTRMPVATALWRAEGSDGSSSRLQAGTLGDDPTPALLWQFALAPGERGRQYAAMRFPSDGQLAGQTGLHLRARADGPRRLWAQLRAASDSEEGERWGRTFYLDETLRQIALDFASFRPLGETTTLSPPLDRVDSLLLVVDTVNSEPGSAGTLWITDLWIVRE